MSTYNKLGGKTLAELPVPPTNLVTSDDSTTEITVTWDNNNILTGGLNVIQRWDDSTSMWIDSGTYASGATSGVTTGATPSEGVHNIRVAVLFDSRYYPSLVTTGEIAENPYPLGGLISRWEFEDDLTDEVGGYDFVKEYGETTTYPTGKVGNCLDNDDAFFRTSGFPNTKDSTYQLTASMWLNLTSGANTDPWLIGGNNGIKISWDALKYRNRANTADIDLSTTLSTGTWYHVLYTYDGSNTRVYVNNVLKLTHPETDTIGGTNNNIYNNHKKLKLDQAYFYNRVLTEAERGKLWNDGDGI